MTYIKNWSSRPRNGVKFEGESKTKRAFKEETDINRIMARYEKTGMLPDMIRSDPQYGDFSNAPDYQTALNIAKKAEEQFGALSAKVRGRFNNDPAQMLAFCNNPANAEEMVNLGLAIKRVATPLEASSGDGTGGSKPPASPEPGESKSSKKPKADQ